jgi:hypothetical protein
LRVTVGYFPIVTKRAAGVERQAGRSGAVCRSVARVFWGKPVFRLRASSQLAESLARGRVELQRDGTGTQRGRGRVSRNAGGVVWSR